MSDDLKGSLIALGVWLLGVLGLGLILLFLFWLGTMIL